MSVAARPDETCLKIHLFRRMVSSSYICTIWRGICLSGTKSWLQYLVTHTFKSKV